MHSFVTFVIVVYLVPTEIEQMKDEESVRLYLKLLESGSEKKRDIRLVVVGRKGAGKTSLIKKLFGENGKAAKTNGIEIHRLRCKSDSDDGMWTKLDRMISTKLLLIIRKKGRK